MFARLRDILRPYYRRHALFRVRRDEAPRTLAARIPLEFQQVAAENVSDVRAFRPADIIEKFQRHLERGQFGIYAYHNGEVIGHGWLIINRGERPIRANRYFRLRPREGLVHFCSVAPQQRGQGVFPALLCELYRRAFESQPVDVIYIDTERTNVSSEKAIAKTAQFLRNAFYVNAFSRGFEVVWPWRAIE